MKTRKSRLPEVYKFGGASLADGAAYKHAAGISKACAAPLAVVCSAPAGATDLLLAVADHARAGDREKTATALEAVREKYRVVLRQVVLGSEGRLGVITSATMKVMPLPARQAFSGCFLPDAQSGMACIRDIVQSGTDLIMARLSLPEETRTGLALSGHGGFKARVLDGWLGLHGVRGDACLMLAATQSQEQHAAFLDSQDSYRKALDEYAQAQKLDPRLSVAVSTRTLAANQYEAGGNYQSLTAALKRTA